MDYFLQRMPQNQLVSHWPAIILFLCEPLAVVSAGFIAPPCTTTRAKKPSLFSSEGFSFRRDSEGFGDGVREGDAELPGVAVLSRAVAGTMNTLCARAMAVA